MAMRISNLSAGALCLTLGMLWGVAGAGGMMQDKGMSDEGMSGHSDKSMSMDAGDTMRDETGTMPMEGDMKAMEAEMPMDKMDDMKEHGEGMGKAGGM